MRRGKGGSRAGAPKGVLPARDRLLGHATPSPPPPAGRPWVLLDTNALFLPFTRRFPLEAEVQRLMEGARIGVPQSVHGELRRLEARGGAHARAARLFADRFPSLPTDLHGDDALESLARELGAWVVTSDRALRTRLEAQGLGVLFPRGDHHLASSPRAPPFP